MQKWRSNPIKMCWDYLLEKKHSEVVVLFIGVALILISSFFSLVVIPDYDGQINENREALSELNTYIDSLYFDYDEHKNWDTQGLILRNAINILDAINNTEYRESIEDRERDLVVTQRYGLEALSRHLAIDNSTKLEWYSMDFHQLQQEKQRVAEIFNDVLNNSRTLGGKLNTKISNLEKERSLKYGLIPITNIAGTLLTQFAVVLHWKKTEQK